MLERLYTISKEPMTSVHGNPVIVGGTMVTGLQPVIVAGATSRFANGNPGNGYGLMVVPVGKQSIAVGVYLVTDTVSIETYYRRQHSYIE